MSLHAWRIDPANERNSIAEQEVKHALARLYQNDLDFTTIWSFISGIIRALLICGTYS
jgi:hypothetical protein